ncbi:hypothetical protein KCP73_26285 [Salmonella enterica subsp. enterica]|nr:hypothetical protein KCP73_26285 [Salmonella enterica subsp. enterica]
MKGYCTTAKRSQISIARQRHFCGGAFTPVPKKLTEALPRQSSEQKMRASRTLCVNKYGLPDAFN